MTGDPTAETSIEVRLRALEEQRDATMLALMALARALDAEAIAGVTTDLHDAAAAMRRRDEPEGARMLDRLAEALAPASIVPRGAGH